MLSSLNDLEDGELDGDAATSPRLELPMAKTKADDSRRMPITADLFRQPSSDEGSDACGEVGTTEGATTARGGANAAAPMAASPPSSSSYPMIPAFSFSSEEGEVKET